MLPFESGADGECVLRYHPRTGEFGVVITRSMAENMEQSPVGE